MTDYACGDYSRLVDDESVSFTQISENVAEDFVLGLTGFAVYYHKAGRVTGVYGGLRDVLLGQVIVKVREGQRGFGQVVLYHKRFSPLILNICLTTHEICDNIAVAIAKEAIRNIMIEEHLR